MPHTHGLQRRKLATEYSARFDANDERITWAGELAELSGRILNRRREAATNTKTAHWFQRGSAGASAGVATLTGGALIASVHGSAAKIIGLGAAAVGFIPAGIAAARPDTSFAIELGRKSQYEQLYWDTRSYTTTKRAVDDRDAFQAIMNTFAARLATIMNSPGSTPASS